MSEDTLGVVEIGDLINMTSIDFFDVSSELWREYIFVDEKTGRPVTVRIDNPAAVGVSENHSHRVLTREGLSYYVPAGWVTIRWKARVNEPHFVK